jgi:hypothetical protein
MKRLFAGLPALVLLSQILLSLVSLLPPVQAQTAARPAGPLSYDVSEEQTLHGTVSSVVTKPATGMIGGSHLLLTTISGPVDASLGVFGLPGEDVASVAAGQQVELTGILKTILDKQVFLVRTVKLGGEVYTIRNEHGVILTPQARERASQKTAGEGL